MTIGEIINELLEFHLHDQVTECSLKIEALRNNRKETWGFFVDNDGRSFSAVHSETVEMMRRPL